MLFVVVVIVGWRFEAVGNAVERRSHICAAWLGHGAVCLLEHVSVNIEKEWRVSSRDSAERRLSQRTLFAEVWRCSRSMASGAESVTQVGVVKAGCHATGKLSSRSCIEVKSVGGQCVIR